MNYAFYILPVLLAVSIPSAFGQVVETKGENYDLIEDPFTGENIWKSTDQRIFINNEWIDFKITEADNIIKFESAKASLIFDKDSCAYSIFAGEEITNDSEPLLPSISWVARTAPNDGSDEWIHLTELNNQSCIVDLELQEKGITITSTKTLKGQNHTIDLLEFVLADSFFTDEETWIENGVEYPLVNYKEFDFNGEIFWQKGFWKTTDNITTDIILKSENILEVDFTKGIKESFKVHNYDASLSDQKFGGTQTIHTGETLTIGSDVFNIEQLAGTVLDRNWIKENNAQIFEIADQLSYDFDIGIELLNTLGIFYDDGIGKIALDYANAKDVTPVGGVMDIDPTTSYTSASTSNLSLPAGTTINFQVWGAGGGDKPSGGGYPYSPGGDGGYSYGEWIATGNPLIVVVGDGGSTGGGSSTYGGGYSNCSGLGGGYTGVFENSVSQNNALIIAGGGGGGGAWYSYNSAQRTSHPGGDGGGLTGNTGHAQYYGSGGTGGTQSAGGIGGASGSSTSLNPGSNGGALFGGAGADNGGCHGGGGGAGYFGGGGGGQGGANNGLSPYYGKGGGGGSSYTKSTLTNTSTTTGGGNSNTNDGSITITYTLPPPPTAPQSLTTSQSVANEIILNWQASSSGSPTNYKIYLDGTLIDTLGNVLTYTDTISGSEIGSGLTYYVIASSLSGDSPASNNSFITSWDVPDAPTGFQAVTGSPITMSWITPNSDDTITNYKIYRDSSLIDTITPANSYTDNTTVAGNSYTYEISAVSAVGESALSSSSTAIHGLPWNPPGSVSAVISDPDNSPFDISVSWSASTQGSGTGTLTGYELWRTNGATTVLVSTLGNVLTYSDTVSLANTNFEYFVKSTSTHGTSGNSPVSNTVTTANVPDAITDLSGNVISDTQINVTWTAPNDGGSNIDLYKIFRDGSQIDTTTNTSYSLMGLTANTAYTITVYVNNSVGDSLVSNTVNLTTYQPVNGSITVTPNTQGASTQLTFSASGITGTPTPTFNTFTLKEGVNVIASGISSPYTLTLNDNNSHTYTITSTDNTHWNTPTISGSTTVTASYDPNWSNGISYNYTRASGVMDLTVNKDSQTLWDATCNYKTTAQVMADQSGIVSNFTNVWYINDSQNIADTDTVYVSCSDDGTQLFAFTSFGPNRLGGGIAQLDAVFGEWTGTPVALIFVLLVAGLFTGRSAPTGILLVLALIGVLGFIGMLTIDEAVWGFLLLAGVLGIFLGKRFL